MVYIGWKRLPVTSKLLMERLVGKPKIKKLENLPVKPEISLAKLPREEVERKRLRRRTYKQRKIISKCRTLFDISEVHRRLVEDGLDDEALVRDTLVDQYEKHDHLESACDMFRSTLKQTPFLCSVVIAAYAQNGHCKEALQAFAEMDLNGIRPRDEASLTSILELCCSEKVAVSVVTDILEGVKTCSDQLCSLFISTLAKLGGPMDAKAAFDTLLLPQGAEVWTSMVSAFARSGHYHEALQLLPRMDLEGVKPSKKTFIQFLIAVSADPMLLQHGHFIHERCIQLGFKKDVHVNTALISMYGACGNILEARAAFDHIRWKNIYAGTSMIVQYVRQGEACEALTLYREMEAKKVQLQDRTIATVLEACAMVRDLDQGKTIHRHVMSGRSSSPLVDAALIVLYAMCGSLEDTMALFRRSYPTRQVMAWNALLGRFSRNGCIQQVLELLRVMDLVGVQPDGVSMLCLLFATCSRGFLARTRDYFLSVDADRGLAYTVEHYGCVLDLLNRSGHLEDAQDLFENMPFEPRTASSPRLLSTSDPNFHLAREE